MRIDALIYQKATGTPEEFASKLGIHRSTLFQSLQEMREMGVDIRYSYTRQSYYYADDRRIIINIEGFLSGKTILKEIV
jgi:biotin operon repressor